MIDNMTFGEWLGMARRERRLSQRQFAELIAVPDGMVVNELEHDRLDPIPYVTAIASGLNADYAFVQTLASAHATHAARRGEKRKSIEANMLAYRLERGVR